MKTQSLFFAVALVASAVFSQDASWLPAKSTGAVIIDVKALRANPMLAKLADQAPIPALPAGKGADLLATMRESVDKILCAMLPGEQAGSAHGVAFASGSFDNAALSAALKADPSCKVSTIEGDTIYATTAAKPGGGSATSYTTFPAKGLAVASDSTDALVTALKTMRKKSPALAGDSMIARAVANSAAKGYPFALVADTSAQAKGGETVPMVGTSLPAFFAFSLQNKDAANLLATLTGAFASEDEAAQAAQALNGMKMMFAMQAAAKPEMADLAGLIGKIVVKNSGKNAVASLLIDEAAAATLSKLAESGMIKAGGK